MIQYIRRTTTSPQGAALHVHLVSSVRASRGPGQEPAFLAVVHSWVTEQQLVAGAAPLHSFTVRLEPPEGTEFSAAVFDSATDLLIQSPEGPLSGGLLETLNTGAVSLEAAKERKRREINAARLAANRSTFEFQGKAIACNELSRSDIDGVNGEVALTGELPPGFPGAWKAVDNTFVAIPTVAVWTQFYQAMVAKGAANFARSESRKVAIDAASTVEEVLAVQW